MMLNSRVSAFKDAFSWFFFFILDAGCTPLSLSGLNKMVINLLRNNSLP